MIGQPISHYRMIEKFWLPSRPLVIDVGVIGIYRQQSDMLGFG